MKTTRIGVDIGGTFTDFVLHDNERGVTWTGKRLTTPEAPERAIVGGVMRLLEETGTAASQIHSIVHATTLITNTVLERTGATVGLITTEGFRDILEMGREIRYDVDDLYLRPVPVVVPRQLRYGVRGRIRADGTEDSGLDETAVMKAAETLMEEQGIEALAIAFLHSYANPSHERRAREIVRMRYPGLPITLSAEVAPEIREYERTNTACVNAYVQPRVHGYLDRLGDGLRSIGFEGEICIMLSGGGVTTIEEAKAYPVRLIESGPAAGATAAAYFAKAIGERNIISFDMGGTTAKMCLIENAHPHTKHEFEAGRIDKFKQGSGLPLKLTVIDMIEIGSGGGSMASIDALGLMKVGPKSAGSVPGPVAYRRGGKTPTVTDSDLLLGYLNPDFFLGGEMALGIDEVERAVATQLAEPLGLKPKTIAVGIQEIVNESMAAATRMHLAEKGRDPRGYTLMALGGAGPVHAYALAKLLGVRRVIVPMGAGVISAFGLLVAAPAIDDVRGYAAPLKKVAWQRVAALYGEMQTRARQLLLRAGGRDEDIVISRTADMRYIGQGFEIEVALPDGVLGSGSEERIRETFDHTYASLFEQAVEDLPVEVINWRLSARLPGHTISLAHTPSATAAKRGERQIHFAGRGDRPATVYDRYALRPGTTIHGPAAFEERESTFIVGPDCTVTVDDHFNLIADIAFDHPGTGAELSRDTAIDDTGTRSRRITEA
jgi:N-methylhydantoinase A